MGVDVAAGTRLRLRYSFSESVSKNPFSRYLDPAGSRGLMNFQNLIGVVLVL
ncbi:MAG: hypothetical protein O3A25_07440 [Acidobacteria bacterium]|nr:hypothetical protein [Acidobacteriota bacterium]